MKRALFSMVLLVLGACHVPVKANSALQDAGAIQKIPSGVLKGKTSKDEFCSLEILSYSEKHHPEIEVTSDREYTDLEKTIELRLDFQHDPAVVFVVKSYMDTMWDAFETNYLSGQHKLEEGRFELVKLYLNHKNQIAAVDYYKDSSHVIMGVPLGDKQVSCYFLR